MKRSSDSPFDPHKLFIGVDSVDGSIRACFEQSLFGVGWFECERSKGRLISGFLVSNVEYGETGGYRLSGCL